MIKTDIAAELVDCLTRARQRDSEAARSLVEYLYPTVSQIVRANVPRSAFGDETLMREIFLELFAKLDQFEGEIPLEHMVARIAVNRCLSAMRAQKFRLKWRMAHFSKRESAALDAFRALLVRDPDPTHLAGARELAERLLEALSPKDRLLIRMMEVEEFTVTKVQELTGWSYAAIRARASRARQKLNWLYWRLILKE